MIGASNAVAEELGIGFGVRMDAQRAVTMMREAPQSVKDLLTLIMFHRNDENSRCFPSVALMSKEMGSTPMTVKRAIKYAEQRGLILVIRSRRRGRFGVNRYTVDFHRLADLFRARVGGAGKSHLMLVKDGDVMDKTEASEGGLTGEHEDVTRTREHEDVTITLQRLTPEKDSPPRVPPVGSMDHPSASGKEEGDSGREVSKPSARESRKRREITFSQFMADSPDGKVEAFRLVMARFQGKGWDLPDMEEAWENFYDHWTLQKPTEKKITWPLAFYNWAKRVRNDRQFQTEEQRNARRRSGGRQEVIDKEEFKRQARNEIGFALAKARDGECRRRVVDAMAERADVGESEPYRERIAYAQGPYGDFEEEA